MHLLIWYQAALWREDVRQWSSEESVRDKCEWELFCVDVAQNEVRCAPFESSCQTASKSLLRPIETQSLELELEVVPNCSKVSICCRIWNILVPKNIFHSPRHSCNPLHLCSIVCFWFYYTKWGLSMAVSWACHVWTIQQQHYRRNL